MLLNTLRLYVYYFKVKFQVILVKTKLIDTYEINIRTSNSQSDSSFFHYI